MLSRTDMCGKSAYAWKTMLTGALAAGTYVTSAPSSRILPLVGSSKPAIIRNVVVLPQPEGPRSEKNSLADRQADVVDRSHVPELLRHVVEDDVAVGVCGVVHTVIPLLTARGVLLAVRSSNARPTCGLGYDMSPRPAMGATTARDLGRGGEGGRPPGHHRLRLADVAAEAGVSVGTIQHYFGTRERLLETFAFETERSLERWLSAEHNGTGAWEQVLALVEIVLHPPTFRERWTRWLQFWAAYARDPKLRPSMGEAYDSWREPFRRAIAAGIESGDFDPVLPEDVVVDRTVALFDGLALQVARCTGHEPRPYARAPRRESRGRPGRGSERPEGREGDPRRLDPLAPAASRRPARRRAGRGAAARGSRGRPRAGVQAVARVRAPVAALLDEQQSSLAQLLGQLPDAARCGGSRPC